MIYLMQSKLLAVDSQRSLSCFQKDTKSKKNEFIFSEEKYFSNQRYDRAHHS